MLARAAAARRATPRGSPSRRARTEPAARRRRSSSARLRALGRKALFQGFEPPLEPLHICCGALRELVDERKEAGLNVRWWAATGSTYQRMSLRSTRLIGANSESPYAASAGGRVLERTLRRSPPMPARPASGKEAAVEGPPVLVATSCWEIRAAPHLVPQALEDRPDLAFGFVRHPASLGAEVARP